MKARDLNIVPVGNGAYLSFYCEDARQARSLHESFKEKDIDVDIKKWREKRSLNANGYAWVLIGQIALRMGKTTTEVYRNAIREVGANYDIVCVMDKAVERLRSSWEQNGIGWLTETLDSKVDGCTNVVLFYGSSTFDTKQMSIFLDSLVQDAKALGIETMTPNELQAMMEAYEKQTNKSA